MEESEANIVPTDGVEETAPVEVVEQVKEVEANPPEDEITGDVKSGKPLWQKEKRVQQQEAKENSCREDEQNETEVEYTEFTEDSVRDRKFDSDPINSISHESQLDRFSSLIFFPAFRGFATAYLDWVASTGSGGVRCV